MSIDVLLDVVIGLEFIFAVCAGLLSYYAYRAYKLTRLDRTKLFSLAFGQISASYVLLAGLTLISLLMFNVHNLELVFGALRIGAINLLLHLLLFMSGIVTLVYMTFPHRSKHMFFFFQGTILFLLIISTNILYIFHLLASIYLGYIAWYYFKRYKKDKNVYRLIIFAAFVFLLFGRIEFIFSLSTPLFLVIGVVLELIAYILLMASFKPILAHGKKR